MERPAGASQPMGRSQAHRAVTASLGTWRGGVPVHCQVSALSFPIFRVAAEEAVVVRAAGCHHVLTVW